MLLIIFHANMVQDGEHVTNNTTTVTVEDVEDNIHDVPPQIAVNVTFDSWSQDHWVTFILVFYVTSPDKNILVLR